jgi:hypothetical protein
MGTTATTTDLVTVPHTVGRRSWDRRFRFWHRDPKSGTGPGKEKAGARAAPAILLRRLCRLALGAGLGPVPAGCSLGLAQDLGPGRGLFLRLGADLGLDLGRVAAEGDHLHDG